MNLTPADLEALANLVRSVVREELANATDSRVRPARVIGALGQGDDRCRQEVMQPSTTDPNSMEIDGESQSLLAAERDAREDIARIQRGLPLSTTSRRRATSRKAGP